MAKLDRKKEQQESSSKPINYTLFNQKITFEFLKAHLGSAADILRGSLDPADLSSARYDFATPEEVKRYL